MWPWLAVLALAAAVVVARRRGAGPRLGLLAGLTAAGLAALAVMAAVTTTVIVVASGVSLGGGVGSRQWSPTQAASLSRQYHLAVGDAQLDLSHLALPPGPHPVSASVGVGKLVIDVPASVAVSIDASSTTGDVTVFGASRSGLSVSQSIAAPSSTAPSQPSLVVDARVGIGNVVIRREG